MYDYFSQGVFRSTCEMRLPRAPSKDSNFFAGLNFGRGGVKGAASRFPSLMPSSRIFPVRSFGCL